MLFQKRDGNEFFLTILVTSAHPERRFSRLKLIKSYLRSVMGQERLTSLSLLSIERGISTMCDYDSIIDNFAAMKTSRKKVIDNLIMFKNQTEDFCCFTLSIFCCIC